jgi:hypothetical protein
MSWIGGYAHKPCNTKKTAAVCKRAPKSCFWNEKSEDCVEAGGDYVVYDPKLAKKYKNVKDGRKLAWAHPTRKLSTWQVFVKKHYNDKDVQAVEFKDRLALLSKKFKKA